MFSFAFILNLLPVRLGMSCMNPGPSAGFKHLTSLLPADVMHRHDFTILCFNEGHLALDKPPFPADKQLIPDD